MTDVAKFALAAGAAIFVSLPVWTAQAAVTVLGAGLAQACYEAALDIGKSKPDTMQLSGSRIGTSAVEICTLALNKEELMPRSMGGTFNNRGVILFAAASFDQALRDFDSAARFAPTIAEVHVNRGATLIALKRWAEGIAAINKGLELVLEEEPEKAYYNRAIAHEELGDMRGAYFDYLKASQLKPEWEQPRRQLTRFTVRPKTASDK